MHKKHYKLLAAALKRARSRLDNPHVQSEDEWRNLSAELINDLEDDLCIVLCDDNPSFSYEKFTQESGRTN